MSYVGYYINLDCSIDRRTAMEAQLARLGLTDQYRRFSAADGRLCRSAVASLTSGELGCFISHYELLCRNLDSAAHLHVLEDDVVLASCTPRLLEQITGSPTIDEYDLLFTDMALPVDFKFYREARLRFDRQVHRATDGTVTGIEFSFFPYISCASSYLVNRRSIRVICDILGHELERGPNDPIDILIRNKVAEGRLRAKSLFPFITSVVPDGFASTLSRGRRDPASELAVDLIRYSFFVECDRSKTLALAEQRLPISEGDFHGRLFAHALGFMISEGFCQP
jgi:GR25 family glycosyltransferase involved in LPS biosynthesis